MHPTSRGIGLYGDKVLFASGEAVLVALDARTGAEVWTRKIAENKLGYYMSVAPLLVDGKIIVGTSGGERGVRGFLAAFDADTGKELWRTHTVPAPGEPGSETWPKGDHWKTGGASIWVTGNYDPETNLTFWGTGNGGPWMGDQRPGDNLYTSSTVAFDVATGQIKGHFQYHPNDSWDWDEVSPPILVDFKRNGRSIKGLIDVARNGYLWFLERTSGKINFVEGTPYVKHNVFRGLDPKTGRPDVDPARQPGTGKEAYFCPSHWGGKNWPPIAYSPQTRMIYIPANENLCTTMIGRPITYTPGQGFAGANSTLLVAPGADHIGEVQAWNVDTGKRVWTYNFPSSANWGPMLATGGGLVFSGGANDRKFRAFDAASGKVLWEWTTNSGIIGQPTSFSVGGKQYIAVQSGWGIDARAMQRTPDQTVAGHVQGSTGGRLGLGVCDQVMDDDPGGDAPSALEPILSDTRDLAFTMASESQDGRVRPGAGGVEAGRTVSRARHRHRRRDVLAPRRHGCRIQTGVGRQRRARARDCAPASRERPARHLSPSGRRGVSRPCDREPVRFHLRGRLAREVLGSRPGARAAAGRRHLLRRRSPSSAELARGTCAKGAGIDPGSRTPFGVHRRQAGMGHGAHAGGPYRGPVMRTLSCVSRRVALLVAVTLLSAGTASADDIKVLTSGAFAAAHLALGPQFERSSSHKVVTGATSTGVGTESIASRLQRGEPADVVILASDAIDDLIAKGLLVSGSKVDLARSAIGMAVRSGARKPDIRTVDGLKRALLDAKSIAYSASVSGVYLSNELFPRLGIAEQIKGKTQRIERERVGAVVARGEAEIGFQQISELLPIAGIDVCRDRCRRRCSG